MSTLYKLKKHADDALYKRRLLELWLGELKHKYSDKSHKQKSRLYTKMRS